MMYVITTKGEKLNLEQKPLGKGGEGEVYRLINPPAQYRDCCVKIYRNPKQEVREKIEFMIQNPVELPSNLRQHIRVCTPLALIFDHLNQSFKGYIMPLAFADSCSLQKLLTRPQKVSWQWKYDLDTPEGFKRRLGLCQNIALSIFFE